MKIVWTILKIISLTLAVVNVHKGDTINAIYYLAFAIFQQGEARDAD